MFNSFAAIASRWSSAWESVWTGTTVRAQLRTVDGRLVWDFVAEGDVQTDTDSDGRFVIALTVDGADTRRWPLGRLEGDVEVQNEGTDWGPYTPAAFLVEVIKDATR